MRGGGWERRQEGSLVLFPKRDAMLTGGSFFRSLLNIKTSKAVRKFKYQQNE